MKFSCERTVILQAASMAVRATSPKSPVPALEGLLLETLDGAVRITGYDLKMGIMSEFEADIIEPGSIVLGAKFLSGILRGLPDETVTFTVGTGTNTRIECGTSLYEIVGSPAADYPALPPIEGSVALTADGGLLSDMINQTIFAVAVSGVKSPIQTGALFEVERDKLTVVAIDGLRLALRCEELDGDFSEKYSFVVPGTSLAEVERIAATESGEIDIIVGDKQVVFKMPKTILVSRKLEGEFYNYRTTIPDSNRFTIFINRRDFIAAVERVSYIINDFQNARSALHFTFDDCLMTIQAVSSTGRAYDECQTEGDGERFEIRLNHRLLLDALRAVPADRLKICLNTMSSGFIMLPVDEADTSFAYLIMPVTM